MSVTPAPAPVSLQAPDRAAAPGTAAPLDADAIAELCVTLAVEVGAPDGHVGRNLEHGELVDVEELVGFGHRRTGHTGKLVVHSEIILECNCSKRLRISLNLYIFFCFDCLMQSITVSSAGQNTTGKLIHNCNLSVFCNYILNIFIK